MSTTRSTVSTTPDLEHSDHTTPAAEDDVGDDLPSFPALTCPRDGTNLEDAYRPEPGRFECPQCRLIWPAWEVVG